MENNQTQSENITIEENSYVKGEKFEYLFAEFMKKELGWEKYIIRSQQKGKSKSRGSQVDVVGNRKDDRHRKLYNLGLLYVLIGCILLISAILSYYYDLEDTITIVCSIVSTIAVLGGFFVMYVSENYEKENAWVECKNRKTKSTYEDVQKSINELKDYKASGDKEYKFVQHYFVSASGFVENALKLAQDNSIECFEYKDGEFISVSYWK